MSQRLPSHSRYKAALILDEEWAEAVAALIGDDDSVQVSAEEWTREQDTLACIYDMLQSVRSVLIATGSQSKGPAVHPMPRPRSAIEKAREKASRKRHMDRVAELTGHRKPTP